MAPRLLLQGVRLLQGPDHPARPADVLIEVDGTLSIAAGSPAAEPPAGAEGAERVSAEALWLAPALVDPHSVLEDPLQGRAETLASLRAAAAAGGYGTVALLPWGSTWRDRPERLDLHWPDPLRLLQWGSFSLEGAERELAPHADQLAGGAIGLAGGDGLPPLDLLERGLRLGEMGDRPVLLPPRDGSLAQQGFVRERVEALRAGWPLDPPISETLPLQCLLTLAAGLPDLSLRLMNLSTAESVDLLRRSAQPPPASVCWWHLITDSGCLDPADEGWRLVPALGAPSDREALIEALGEGLISAVAVHHLPLDAEERLLPLDQRRAGLAGHGVALSLLWAELVERRGWSPERLWQALCWGPSRFLGLAADTLLTGSRRWILFDPARSWTWDASSCRSLAANQPRWNESLQGAVVASGFSDPQTWTVPGGPWH
jgi:dihydroorotase